MKLSGIALVALVVNGCSGVVSLAPGHYPAMLDTGEVRVIDARVMERSRVEQLLDDHHVIARFDVRTPGSADFEQQLAEEVEKGKPKALDAGGNVLMFTDDSEMIAVTERDAHYAGASDALTMYVMLRR
jgi:hypothetical protein